MTISRRAWVSEGLRAISMAATAFVGLVGLKAARPSTSPVERVRVAALREDSVSIVGDAVVVRRGELVRAFSVHCPHLGCRLGIDVDGDALTCPCHGSRFDLDGNRISGPATRGLRELQVEVMKGT